MALILKWFLALSSESDGEVIKDSSGLADWEQIDCHGLVYVLVLQTA